MSLVVHCDFAALKPTMILNWSARRYTLVIGAEQIIQSIIFTFISIVFLKVENTGVSQNKIRVNKVIKIKIIES